MKQNRKFWHFRTAWLPILLGVLVVGGLLLGAQSASAQTSGADGCIQDVWAAHGNTQALTCTANDVRIAEVTNITVNAGGSGSCTSTAGNCTCTPAPTPPTNCATNPGQFGCVTFTADYKVILGAQTRYDIGLYIATDGGGADGALTGQCFDSVITSANAPSTYESIDGDICGDITNDAAHNPQIVHFTVSTACVAGPDGKLKLPNCTSWRQPGSNTVCSGFSDAYPGSPSKCNCQPGFEVNILVQKPSISVTKTASPTQVQEGPDGGFVTYTIDVANNSTCSPTPCTPTSVTIASLSDNVYGDITISPPTNPLIQSTTCSVPQTIAGGSVYTCSFIARVSGLDAAGITAPDHLTDTVCASGTDANHTPVQACGQASVSAFNVNPTGTVSKSLNTLLCADVRYNETVTNTDQVEPLTLSALSDDGFGDITTVHGNVLATTCLVPQTLAANGGQYSCTFDAHFCGGSHTNTVSATLSDDEGNTVSPTGSATVTVTAQ